MSSGHNNRLQRIPLLVASEPDNVGAALGTGPIERRLAAFLALDIKDYAAMISRDEAGAHRRVGRDLVIIVRQIHKQAGRILQFTGDGLLAEFSSATATLKAALSIQASSRNRNRRRSADDRIEYRIGINSGDFVVQSGRVGGDTINIAARLEQIAEPGGICISEVVQGKSDSICHLYKHRCAAAQEYPLPCIYVSSYPSCREGADLALSFSDGPC
jgi:class 3 adenylate cyclase